LRADARRELDEEIDAFPRDPGAAAENDLDVCVQSQLLAQLFPRRALVAAAELGL
jgi:hypothetical protein